MYPDGIYPKIVFVKDCIEAWIRYETDDHIILVCQDLTQSLPLTKRTMPVYELVNKSKVVKVKYKGESFMQYRVLEESETMYKIEFIGWILKSKMEVIEGECDLPEVTDVMVYIANDRNKL